MGEAKRRRNGQAPKAMRGLTAVPASTPGGTPIVPPAALPIFGLKAVGTAEQIDANGQKVQAMVFRLVTADGTELVQQTASGDQPVQILAMLVVVGQTVVVPDGRIARG
jgi:hypothetical protein